MIELDSKRKTDQGMLQMNKDNQTIKGFEFRSVLYKRFLWTMLLLVLISDAASIPALFSNWNDRSTLMLSFALLGLGVKLGLLYVLLIKRGPVDVLVYFWGGLFVFTGSTGLLALALSSESVPIINYLDKGLFLVLGLILIVPFGKSVKIIDRSS